MHPLNERFAKVFCINLDREPDRWRRVSGFFAHFGIEVERIAGVDGEAEMSKLNPNPYGFHSRDLIPLTAAWFGCTRSHLAIYDRIVAENLPSAFIFEDDAVFRKDFNAACETALAELPSDYDVLQLGQHFCGLPEESPTYRRVSATLEMNRPSRCTHAYGVTNRMARELRSFVHTPLSKPYFGAFHRDERLCGRNLDAYRRRYDPNAGDVLQLLPTDGYLQVIKVCGRFRCYSVCAPTPDGIVYQHCFFDPEDRNYDYKVPPETRPEFYFPDEP